MNATNRIMDINELDADTRRAALAFLQKCKEAGLDVKITETYRSQTRQDYLYAQGRTRPGKIVTWTRSSNHTNRRAFDICRNVKGREYDDSDGFFRKCAEIGKSLGLNCGYFWTKFQDKPHLQLDVGKKPILSGIVNDNISSQNNSAGKLSQETKQALKSKLKGKYNFADSTCDFILSYKHAEALAMKLLERKEISKETKDFILSFKHGKEILERVYG